MEKSIKDKERLAKAKDYAQKQRKIVKKNVDKQKAQVEVIDEASRMDPAGVHTNFHSEFTKQEI